MYRPHRLIPIIALLLLLPAAAAAQSAPSFDGLLERSARAGLDRELTQTILDRARERGLDPRAAARLVEPALGLAAEDLPAEPVLEKALEGLAKGVPAARVEPVVGDLASGTREVGSFVRGWAQSEEVRTMLADGSPGAGPSGDRATGEPSASSALIEGGARARIQGVSQARIEAFLADLPARTARRPIAPGAIADALRALPEVGAGAATGESVARLLTEAVDAGLSGETMRQIPGALQAASRQTGRPVEALARSAAARIGAGAGASQVLATLFEGGTPGLGPAGGGPGEGTPPGQDLPPGSGPPGDDVGSAGEDPPGPPGSNPGGNGSPGGGPPEGVPPGGDGSR